MARPRGDKRGSFRPPELRGTLGTLLRTTLQQAGVVREVLERGAREGRSRLDEALSSRRRNDALAQLGELVLDLIRRGEIDLAELPEAEELVRQLDELDDHEPFTTAPDIAQPSSRRRFDDRPSAPATRAPLPRRGASDDDGTVSSSRWSPPRHAAAPARVWRPSLEDAPPDPARTRARDDEPTEPPPARRAPPRDPGRRGGIHFADPDDDPDADLADYMHPDDVPPKPPRGS